MVKVWIAAMAIGQKIRIKKTTSQENGFFTDRLPEETTLPFFSERAAVSCMPNIVLHRYGQVIRPTKILYHTSSLKTRRIKDKEDIELKDINIFIKQKRQRGCPLPFIE